MSSEDVLPTYDEAMKMYQTPWHIIEEEAMNLTFRQHSTASSKIKSFISRTESASQHGVYTGPKRKSKIVVFVENMFTGRHKTRDKLQSEQYTDLSLQLELRRSSTSRSFERDKKTWIIKEPLHDNTQRRRPMMQSHSIPEPKPWLSQQTMLSFIILAMYRWMTNDKNETKQLSVVIEHTL